MRPCVTSHALNSGLPSHTSACGPYVMVRFLLLSCSMQTQNCCYHNYHADCKFFFLFGLKKCLWEMYFRMPRGTQFLRNGLISFLEVTRPMKNKKQTKKIFFLSHFTDDKFMKKWDFNSGVITRLLLKDNATPTLRSTQILLLSAQVSWKTTPAVLFVCLVYVWSTVFICNIYYKLCSLIGLHHILVINKLD